MYICMYVCMYVCIYLSIFLSFFVSSCSDIRSEEYNCVCVGSVNRSGGDTTAVTSESYRYFLSDTPSCSDPRIVQVFLSEYSLLQ